MTEQVHSLQLKIDAAAAEAGSKRFTAALSAVKKAVSDLDRAADGTFAKLANHRPEFDVTPLRAATTEANRLSTALAGTGSASDRAAATIQRTALASASAVRMAEQATQRLALRMGDLGDTQGVASLNAALAQMKAQLVNATTPLDVRVAKSGFDDLRSALLQTTVEAEHLRGAEAQLAREMQAANAAAASHADTLNRLRAAHDPLFAASQRYAAALSEIDQLTAANALTEAQASAARERAAQTYLALDAAADRASATTDRAAAASTSLMYNLQDVGVMMAAGQNPFMLAMQQGTQIAGALEASGVKGAKAFELLKTAALSVVSPLSLISIGLVFLSATAVQAGERLYAAFADGEHKVVDTKQALDTLAQSIRSASDAAAGTSFRAMRDEFGAATAEVRALVAAKKELAAVEQQRALESARDSLAFDVAGVGALDVLRGYANNEKGRILEIRDALDLTRASATQLENLFRQSEGVSNARELAGVYAQIRQVLIDATGGVNNMNAAQREVYGKLVESEAAARRLAAAQDGAAGAANNASGAASGLAYTIGTAADEAARLLMNLNSVPGALAVMGKSVEGQIASIRAQNRALSLELSEGLSSAAANRRVQLETMVTTAGERGQRITPDAIAAEWMKINELDAAAKETERLRNQITEKNRPARSAGGGGRGGGGRASALKEEETALDRLKKSVEDRVLGLNSENAALQLVISGQVDSVETAKLMVDAMTASGGAVDAQTTAMIAQIDAAAKLNEALKKLATDPVKDWMESVPNWIEAGKQIEMGAINSLRDSIADMIKTGKLDFESLGEAVLGVFADVVSDKAVKELLTLFGRGETGSGGWLGGLFGDLFASQGDSDVAGMVNGGTQAGAVIGNSMITAGTQVAAQIQAAMTGAGAQAGMSVQSGLATGSVNVRTAAQTGLAMGANSVRVAATTAGPVLGQGVVQGAQAGAPILAQGVAAGAQSGGILSGVGGFGGLMGMILPGLFSEGGYSTSPVASAMVPPTAFHHAPHFSEGGVTSGGIPAVLHPNEAVIPLSRGRKIPVEMGETAGGTNINAPQYITINTPDADSFRRSQKQIAADMARAGQRAVSQNG